MGPIPADPKPVRARLLYSLPLLALAAGLASGCSDDAPVNPGQGGAAGSAGTASGAGVAGTTAGTSSTGGVAGSGVAGSSGAAGSGVAGSVASGGAGAGSGGSLPTGGLGGDSATGGTSGSSGDAGIAGVAGTAVDPCASVTCGEGQVCQNGSCMCTEGTLCMNSCVDTQEDHDNCGSCGNACAADGACVDGSCVNPMCNPDTQVRNGHITTYNLATPMVACHWQTNTLPQYYGAMNEFDWNNAGVCGACVEITNTQNQNKLVVQIVDECPKQGNEQWCFEGSHHIDLNGAAYGALGANNNPAINWKFVACNSMGNIKYFFDSASMQYYLAVSPQNYKNPLKKLEVKKDGAFTELTRNGSNMYEAKMGAGTGELTFRLTDIYNHVITDTVTMNPGQTVDGKAQFPACP